MITIAGGTSVDDATIGEVGIRKNIIGKGEPLEVITSGIGEGAILTIHGIKGQLLHQSEIPARSENVEVAVPDFSAGVYIYVIRTATQKFLGQFIVEAE